MSNEFNFSSIAEVNNALLTGRYDPKELYEFLKEKWNGTEQVTPAISGSEDEFHNLSVDFRKMSLAGFAADVAKMGVSIYPLSTDLIADVIKYSKQTGNFENCRWAIDTLKKIDRKYWTWRTFVFVIDYYKDSHNQCGNVADVEQNFKEALDLIEEFKQTIPFEERAYMAEAEIYESQNDYEKFVNALKCGIKNVSVAPQCCLKIADFYLQTGEYELVCDYAKRAILAAAQDQPSISLGYVYYILALSMDVLRTRSVESGELVDSSTVKKIITTYEIADKLFVNEGRENVAYRKNIEARLTIIQMES